MNALVVYDSVAGNTARMARVVAEVLARSGQARVVPVRELEAGMLRGVDVLVVGSPTQRRRPTPAMEALVGRLPAEALRGLAVAAFDTRFNMPRWMTGSAACAIARALERRGAVRLGRPESFYVLGTEGPLAASEPERAAAWARRLCERHQALCARRLTLSQV